MEQTDAVTLTGGGGPADTGSKTFPRRSLAILVMSRNDRPIVDWPGMGQPASLDDVRVVHAAVREACALDEIERERAVYR